MPRTPLTSDKSVIRFWSLALPALTLFGVLLHMKGTNSSVGSVLQRIVSVLPFGTERVAFSEVLQYLLQKDDRTRTILVLLQNNFDLTPAGGQVEAFAIVQVRNGQIVDTTLYDVTGGVGIPALPKKKNGGPVDQQTLKDYYSTLISDLPTNAQTAQSVPWTQDDAQVAGIVALNMRVVATLFSATQTAVLQDTGAGQSGSQVLAQVFGETLERIAQFPSRERTTLTQHMITHLNNKNLQLHFYNPAIQETVAKAGWAGAVDQTWSKDYAFVVDTTISSLEQNAEITRSLAYSVDLSEKIPQGTMHITYRNTTTTTPANFDQSDHRTYVRLYVPERSWFVSHTGAATEPTYGEEFGKKYIGFFVTVPAGAEHTVSVTYNLPLALKNAYPYDLKIQKQPGIDEVPVSVSVTQGDGFRRKFALVMDQDIILSNQRIQSESE